MFVFPANNLFRVLVFMLSDNSTLSFITRNARKIIKSCFCLLTNAREFDAHTMDVMAFGRTIAQLFDVCHIREMRLSVKIPKCILGIES